MQVASKKSKPARFRLAFLPYFILFICLLTTSLFAYYVARNANAKDRTRFNNSVHEIYTAIENRLDTYIALTHATTGLFAASHQVEFDEFRSFVQQLQLRQRYPGIQGIGFVTRLRPEQRAALIASLQQQGMKNFHIFLEQERAEYYPIVYLEPLDRRNQAAIGFDMFTEPVRRAAMEEARDTGAPTASGKVTLIQEIDTENRQAGFLIFAPVYARGAQVSSPGERRAALQGFVYSPFRTDDLLASILKERNFDVDVQIYDGTPGTADNLLHSYSGTGGSHPNTPRFIATTTMDVAGRRWTLNYAANAAFDSASGTAYLPYTFAAGVFLSFLFFFVTRSQAQARTAAERSAAEVRASEARVRQTLQEREQTEQALRESEERYRELVENANDIVYTLDLQGQVTSINKAAELVTEYSREELLGMNITDILTKDSAQIGLQMLDRKIGGKQRTNYEVDLRAKSGQIVTLEISSRLIFKDGQALAVQGIARNITARRRAEEVLRQADQRALSEYERLLERISGLAQALGAARDLLTIF